MKFGFHIESQRMTIKNSFFGLEFRQREKNLALEFKKEYKRRWKWNIFESYQKLFKTKSVHLFSGILKWCSLQENWLELAGFCCFWAWLALKTIVHFVQTISRAITEVYVFCENIKIQKRNWRCFLYLKGFWSSMFSRSYYSAHRLVTGSTDFEGTQWKTQSNCVGAGSWLYFGSKNACHGNFLVKIGSDTFAWIEKNQNLQYWDGELARLAELNAKTCTFAHDQCHVTSMYWSTIWHWLYCD